VSPSKTFWIILSNKRDAAASDVVETVTSEYETYLKMSQNMTRSRRDGLRKRIYSFLHEFETETHILRDLILFLTEAHEVGSVDTYQVRTACLKSPSLMCAFLDSSAFRCKIKKFAAH